jgi:hypothetical protein
VREAAAEADLVAVGVAAAVDTIGRKAAAVVAAATPAPATGSVRIPAAAILILPGGTPATNARPPRVAAVAAAAVDLVAAEDAAAVDLAATGAAVAADMVVAVAVLAAATEAETATEAAAAPCAAGGEATVGIGLTKQTSRREDYLNSVFCEFFVPCLLKTVLFLRVRLSPSPHHSTAAQFYVSRLPVSLI